MMMQSYAECSLNANQNYSQLEFCYCIPVNCLEKENEECMREEQKEWRGKWREENQILGTLKPWLVPNDWIFIG